MADRGLCGIGMVGPKAAGFDVCQNPMNSEPREVRSLQVAKGRFLSLVSRPQKWAC